MEEVTWLIAVDVPFVLLTLCIILECSSQRLFSPGSNRVDMTESKPLLPYSSNAQPPTSSNTRSPRSSFLLLLLLAVGSRSICLFVEILLFHDLPHSAIRTNALVTIIRTVPALFFASNYSVLLLFLAQLLQSIAPPPVSNNGYVYDSFLSCLYPLTLSPTISLPFICVSCNVLLFSCYLSIVLLLYPLSIISTVTFQSAVFLLLSLTYSNLFLLLLVVSPSLLHRLSSGTRPSSSSNIPSSAPLFSSSFPSSSYGLSSAEVGGVGVGGFAPLSSSPSNDSGTQGGRKAQARFLLRVASALALSSFLLRAVAYGAAYSTLGGLGVPLLDSATDDDNMSSVIDGDGGGRVRRPMMHRYWDKVDAALYLVLELLPAAAMLLVMRKRGGGQGREGGDGGRGVAAGSY